MWNRIVPNHSVTPDWFRGPPIRKPRSLDVAVPWMPERARHDGIRAAIFNANRLSIRPRHDGRAARHRPRRRPAHHRRTPPSGPPGRRRRVDRIALIVRDRGPGFSDERLASFGKPYQSSKREPGHGLGLFLAVNVMRKLGGGVSVVNCDDGGAEVTIRMPLSAIALS